MAFARATVESWTDDPCASWVEGGGTWDVKESLSCDASEQQLWLVFSLLLTAYCVQSRFFGTLRYLLVSAFAGITLVLLWHILYWTVKLEVAWSLLWDGICILLIALSCFGTYENSLFTGRTITIFESRNPAFGGRGPGNVRVRVKEG